MLCTFSLPFLLTRYLLFLSQWLLFFSWLHSGSPALVAFFLWRTVRLLPSSIQATGVSHYVSPLHLNRGTPSRLADVRTQFRLSHNEKPSIRLRNSLHRFSILERLFVKKRTLRTGYSNERKQKLWSGGVHLRKKKRISERVSLGVMHIIRSEPFWREKSRQNSHRESRQESRIGLYAWLPARLSEIRSFTHIRRAPTATCMFVHSHCITVHYTETSI